MSWGVPRRPRVSTKISYPNPREGSDGDLQVRQTNLGAKLFGKVGGRWYSAPLTGMAGDPVTRIGTNLSNHLNVGPDKLEFIKGSKSMLSISSAGDINMTGKINITSTEDRNICIGTWSSGNPDAGDDNISIGVDAGKLLEDGSQQNISIGSYAGDAVTTNDYNVAIGYNALTANNGTSNIGIGPSAGSTLQGGIGNLYIGMTAQSSGTSVNNEFAIGGWAAAGQGVTGKGSNTGTLGQASCTDIYMSEDSGADIHCKDLEYSGALNASDIRIKKNIKDFSLGLDFINKLRTVSFNFRAPSEWDEDLKIKEWWYQRDRPEPRTDVDMVRIGFIAQEVKESLGDVESNIHIINGDEADDKQSLDYTKFVIPLTKAVQELSAKIDTMQTEINNLKAE